MRHFYASDLDAHNASPSPCADCPPGR